MKVAKSEEPSFLQLFRSFVHENQRSGNIAI
jgi:hypothetical protein